MAVVQSINDISDTKRVLREGGGGSVSANNQTHMRYRRSVGGMGWGVASVELVSLALIGFVSNLKFYLSNSLCSLFYVYSALLYSALHNSILFYFYSILL